MRIVIYTGQTNEPKEDYDKLRNALLNKLKFCGLDVNFDGVDPNGYERFIADVKGFKGGPGRSPKLTAEQIQQIREQYASGVSKNKLAREYGTCWETIDKAIKNK